MFKIACVMSTLLIGVLYTKPSRCGDDPELKQLAVRFPAHKWTSIPFREESVDRCWAHSFGNISYYCETGEKFLAMDESTSETSDSRGVVYDLEVKVDLPKRIAKLRVGDL